MSGRAAVAEIGEADLQRLLQIMRRDQRPLTLDELVAILRGQ